MNLINNKLGLRAHPVFLPQLHIIFFSPEFCIAEYKVALVNICCDVFGCFQAERICLIHMALH